MLRRTLHCSTTNRETGDGSSAFKVQTCVEKAAPRIGQVSSYESFSNLRKRLGRDHRYDFAVGQQNEFPVGTKLKLSSTSADSEAVKVEIALGNDFRGANKEQ